MHKVLVVDDHPAILELFETMLSEVGFEVTCATNGRAALQCLGAGAFGLMITDLVMPDYEGLALISSAKILHPSLKIIAVSGAWEGEFLHAAKLMGADRVLEKPLRRDQLLEAVSGVLGMD